MARNARTFTPAEAGVVSGLGRKAIDNAIDKKVIPAVAKPSADPKQSSGGSRKRRQISETDLVWIYVNSRAPAAIPPDQRAPLYRRFATAVNVKSFRVSDLVLVDVAAARREIKAGAAALDRAKANIVSDPKVLDGEPVFKGTRVPVYDVAASMEKGLGRERILASYPTINEDALEQARLYAEAFPPRGRPRGVPRTRPSLVLVDEKVVRRKQSG